MTSRISILGSGRETKKQPATLYILDVGTLLKDLGLAGIAIVERQTQFWMSSEMD
jgi:hypothetical protein